MSFLVCYTVIKPTLGILQYESRSESPSLHARCAYCVKYSQPSVYPCFAARRYFMTCVGGVDRAVWLYPNTEGRDGMCG